MVKHSYPESEPPPRIVLAAKVMLVALSVMGEARLVSKIAVPEGSAVPNPSDGRSSVQTKVENAPIMQKRANSVIFFILLCYQSTRSMWRLAGALRKILPAFVSDVLKDDAVYGHVPDTERLETHTHIHKAVTVNREVDFVR